MAVRAELRALYGIDDLDHTGALSVRRLHVVPPSTVHLGVLTKSARSSNQPWTRSMPIAHSGVAGEFGRGIDELEPETGRAVTRSRLTPTAW
ncbi:hypothetical protein Hmuk_3267 (plasmid) [Halomicrobium mukohataei DSM 12286]|uniref:Uncharacterized protein n=1 Tax=Halomicrobium mukohataei (strain ATCC 700874 / DSM 12286 / JCM 9738 / NCIMB 13541) TaxID=485914 RepID=C7P4X2_HALMD|nr:hypothetical protein [Halomicrobium mukohataei]ACV49367.1 hypothetical protein Hmuk_3267 [Halomicrobium mukohataei DSM 12286]